MVRDTAERFLRIKSGIPAIALVEFRYAEGQEGPEKHIHREHCDCFYVQEGRLAYFVADDWHELEAGGFVMVPPQVVHTFRNDGPGEARFLNLHIPDRGFADSLRGRREGFDQFDPPEDGGRPGSEAIMQTPASHELASVTEIELDPGEETRVTGHFYVLEGTSAGTATFGCEDEVLRAGDERVRALVIA